MSTMETIIAFYLIIGIIMAAVTAVVFNLDVLNPDGKIRPSKIAYYSTVNGLAWPMVIAYIVKHKKQKS